MYTKKKGDKTRVATTRGTIGTDKIHDRRKAARFRPVKEKMVRIYLNDSVRHALVGVARQFLEMAFQRMFIFLLFFSFFFFHFVLVFWQKSNAKMVI